MTYCSEILDFIYSQSKKMVILFSIFATVTSLMAAVQEKEVLFVLVLIIPAHAFFEVMSLKDNKPKN